jgi:acyl carrier protein
LYRTGDRGRWRSDGLLEFLGRVDHQIKIRGHRIEPGEVESRLAAHPQVAEACVLARRLDDGSHQLVAYVVATNGDPSELRTYLAETLPEFMLPSFFVFLDRLPLSTNGKVDRRSLPEPDVAAIRSKCHTNPRNPTEQLLAEIWSELLGVDDIGVEDNFFELGGHSLLAIQLRTRIRSAFDVEIPLTELMTATTIERLAARVEETIIADIEAMSDASAERLIAQMVE